MRRAVITGLGVIAPNGGDLERFWTTLREGASAGASVTRVDPSAFPCNAAAEVKYFDPAVFLSRKQIQRTDLATQFALAAAKLAVQDAGIGSQNIDPHRMGVVDGISLGGIDGIIGADRELSRNGYKGISFYSILNGFSGSGAGEIAQELGARAHASTFCSGSASSNDAIGYAYRMIQIGDADIMVAGGTEAPIRDAVWAAFCKSAVMTRGPDPVRAMKPFDETRDGFLLGEGAAFVIIEDCRHAINRGARIYAEILGHGRSCESYHPLAPHPEGIGVSESIAHALRSGNIGTDEIDYINAHGTATPANDSAESIGIRNAFGDQASKIPVSATKPITGHLLGAAGALETVVCTLALLHQEIPPTLNLFSPAEHCDLDYVPVRPRRKELNIVLNLNSGFGGKNSCLAIGKFFEDGRNDFGVPR